MRIKDILIVILVALCLYPIVLAGIMFATGFMQVEFGWDADVEKEKEKIETIEYDAYRDSLAAVHSKSFQAFEAQRRELESKRRRLAEDEKRLKQMKKEISRRTDDLNKTKDRLEKLVKKSSDLKERRIKKLADVYESMRAEEAAPILFTLKDAMIVKIMLRIGDDRQKGKIMAAMAEISKERAGRISRKMSDLKIK